MELHFHRPSKISCESRQMPADVYNRLHLLFSHSKDDCLYVPIRSMQYLAVIDQDEIIFVDGQGPREIELGWRDFQPQQRQGLNDPVSYHCIYYQEKGLETMKRLQVDFSNALQLLEEKQERPQTASVTYI